LLSRDKYSPIVHAWDSYGMMSSVVVNNIK
jgi:hypothetical protein